MARVEIPTVVENSTTGLPVSGASVLVTYRSSGAPVTWYTSESSGAGSTAAIITDANGRVTAWVPRGAYNLTISGTGITTYTEPFDALPASDGAGETAWLPDGSITNAKLLTGIDPAKLLTGIDASKVTVGTLPVARLPASGVGNAQVADGSLSILKQQASHGLAFNSWGSGGSGTQVPANTTTNIITANFTARATRALIIGNCDFNEIRGGVGSAYLGCGVIGKQSGQVSWSAGAGYGGSGIVVCNVSGLTPGSVYTAYTSGAVVNETITLQAHGPATVLIFDQS